MELNEGLDRIEALAISVSDGEGDEQLHANAIISLVRAMKKKASETKLATAIDPDVETRALRQEVYTYAYSMETRLRELEGKKKHWLQVPTWVLLNEIERKMKELNNSPDVHLARRKAVSLGNYAMMVMDRIDKGLP